MPVHTPAYQQFLARLRQARIEAGFTQSVVAARFERPQSFIAKCEAGDRRVDAVELHWFSQFYGKAMEWFVTGEDSLEGKDTITPES